MAWSILIPKLPRFVQPMLAKQGAPFDSPEHLFEIKWDGTRVLAFVDSNGYRLVNRHRVDVTDRFPELRFLANLPAGIVLDGTKKRRPGLSPRRFNGRLRTRYRTSTKRRRKVSKRCRNFFKLNPFWESLMDLDLALRRPSSQYRRGEPMAS